MSEQPVTTETNVPEDSNVTHISRTQEEPPVPPVQVSGESDPKMFTQEDLERARQQEKQKLYSRLETVQQTVAELQAEREERLRQEQAQREAAEAEARKQAEEEMSAKELIAQKEAEWRQQQQELRDQIEAERALRERETQYSQLVETRQQIVNEYSERILPELQDMVTGNTPEEIRQSAENLAQRSDAILAQTQEAMQNARQQMPGTRITTPASGGVDDRGAARTYTASDIRGMSMEEYAKQRRNLLGQGADGPKNRGLFG